MGIIKTLIFHVLLTFRGLVLFISKLLSLMFLICFVMIVYSMDYHQAPMTARVMMLSFGIIFTLINWFYDYLIFYFKPENFELVLSL